MKAYISLIIFIFSSSVFAQKTNHVDFMSLKGPVQLPTEMQIKFCIQNVINDYGKSFMYYNELFNGWYNIEKSTKGFEVNVMDVRGNILDKLEIIKFKRTNNIEFYGFDDRQIDKLIDKSRLKEYKHIKSPLDADITPIITDNIIRDIEICNFGDAGNFGKILNENLTLHYVLNQNDSAAIVFYDIAAGTFIPYDNGLHAKLFDLDNIWGAITMLDRDNYSLGGKPYGYSGLGNNMFMNPTSFTFGSSKDYSTYVRYPAYICDNAGHKLVEVDFKIYTTDNNKTGFDDNTYRVLDTLIDPYDVSYFSVSPDSTSTDKLWVSQSLATTPTLVCLDTSGTVQQTVIGYYSLDNQQEYRFLPDSYVKLCAYNEGFSDLCFIDNIRNYLVCCLLNPDGTANITSTSGGYLIEATEVVHFSTDYSINSVHFQKTNPYSGTWPYVWVTSGLRPPLYGDNGSMIHLLKMDKAGYVQYMGSTSKPRNTDYSFSSLKNLMMVNGITPKKWTN